MAKIVQLTGIYQAEGGISGHLRYAWGIIRGTAHCALCDTTHGGLTMTSSFKACRTRLGVPFDLIYLADRDDRLRAFTEGKTPCVVGHDEDGALAMLLDGDALEAVAGDVEGFEAALRGALAAAESADDASTPAG